MEAELIDQQDYYAVLFWQHVVANLHYWHQYVLTHRQDYAALQQEQDQITNALDYALELKTTWPNSLELLDLLASFMERSGSWDVWQRLLSRAVQTARQIQDKPNMVKLWVMLARLFQRQGHDHNVIATYRQVIRLARDIDDFENRARAYSNLGFLYGESGYWWRAEVLCCQALAIFKELKHSHGIAHTENHLGSLYTRQGRWHLAQKYFEQACHLWQSMGDHHSLMRGFMNLGGLYCDMERPNEAVTYLQRALQEAEIVGEEAEIGIIYTNLATAYRINKDPATAELYNWQAEAIFRRFGNILGTALVHDNLGLIAMDQKKWQVAASHLNTALTMWRDLKNRWGEVRHLTYWVEYELAQRNTSQAAKRLEKVEQFISKYGLNDQQFYWQSRLKKYRDALTAQ